MRVHNIEVTDRAAYVDDRDLVQGTVKADICKFSFDSDWDGLSITVTFVSDSDQATPTYDEESKQCVVPWEVLTGSGSVQMGIEGVDSSGSVVRTAQLASPFNVKPSFGPKPGSTDPTESEYKQVISDARDAINDTRDAVADTQKAISSVNTAASNADAKAEAAKQAAELANQGYAIANEAASAAVSTAGNAAANANDAASSATAAAANASKAASSATAAAANASKAAQDVNELAQSIEGKYIENVTASTLDAGQQATAQFDQDTHTLQLGIPKGEKGDKFAYSDFTEEQISELQKPAADAALVANAAAESANTAKQNADKATASANAAASTANTAASNANSKASAAQSAATAANAAASSANTAATAANDAATKATTAADNANAAAEAVSLATVGLSPKQLQALVRSGKAAEVLRVGDQVMTTYTWDGTAYDMPLDVVHHFDGSDDDHPLLTVEGGEQVKAMMLQCHYALPPNIPYCGKQAFFVPTAELAPGQYQFTVKVTDKWGTGVSAAVGSKTYTFTTTKAIPAGGQCTWNGSYTAKPTSFTSYAQYGSDAIETVSITEGTGGTDLGAITDTEVGEQLNNIGRACEGSNKPDTSFLYAWMGQSGDTTDWTPTGKFERPSSYTNNPGMLKGFDTSLLDCCVTPTWSIERHPLDGGSYESNLKVFNISARQHYFSAYLDETADSYTESDVPLDYWVKVAQASGMTAPWVGWQRYPELITYGVDNHLAARDVWLRSVQLSARASGVVGRVSKDGYTDSASASLAYAVAPALCIG